MKTIITFFLVAASLTLTANKLTANETKPTTKEAIAATVVEGGKVLITGMSLTDATAQYEIQRSSDNKNFSTAYLVFADEAGKTLSIKDNPAKGTKIVYYRVKIIKNNTVTYSTTVNVVLQGNK